MGDLGDTWEVLDFDVEGEPRNVIINSSKKALLPREARVWRMPRTPIPEPPRPRTNPWRTLARSHAIAPRRPPLLARRGVARELRVIPVHQDLGVVAPAQGARGIVARAGGVTAKSASRHGSDAREKIRECRVALDALANLAAERRSLRAQVEELLVYAWTHLGIRVEMRSP